MVLIPLEMPPERLIDNLGDRQVVQVCLFANRVNPALFDVESGALGFPAGIAGLGEGCLALVPLGRKFLKGGYQTYKPLIVDRRYTSGGQRGLSLQSENVDTMYTSVHRVYKRCT